MTSAVSESRACALQTCHEPTVMLSEITEASGYFAKKSGGGAGVNRILVSANGSRQAGGLGVSPSLPVRAGGWEEWRLAAQNQEHYLPRDTWSGDHRLREPL